MEAFGAAALLLGVASLGYALYLYKLGTASQSWPKTAATITHISVEHTGSTGGTVEESQQEWYLPVLEYTYTVRGRAVAAGARRLSADRRSMIRLSRPSFQKAAR